MTKKILYYICITIISFLLTACSNTAGEDNVTEETRIDEGTDTKCEVNYSPYDGEHTDMFLSRGDKIAVIAPSSCPSKEQTEATINGLKSWGYIPVEGSHIYDEIYTSRDIEEDLKWALEDNDIKAIFCIRGGYGASEIMDEIPLQLVKDANKLIIGYSDITVYHSAWSCSGLPSIHSCMSVTFDGLHKECADAEKAILQGSIPEYTCKSNEYCKKGTCDGILIGGNLSTFCSVLGTHYDISNTDEPYIIFLEDVGEDLQHIHRYLTILKHSGVLDNASGIIFGEWIDMPSDLGDYLGKTRGGEYKSIAEMISRQFLDDLDIPVAFGFPAGHGDINYPLLMGEKVHLCVDKDNYSLSFVSK
ncbi:MAG: LD-carboxypeptidase [Lachnospiraceae bacterium]|nr:LD-carboxypeptidase [Lachnospiraceae bacterium]